MAVGSIARKPFGQQIAYVRLRILGAAGNATYSIGWLPAGANILRISTSVRVVFAGGTPTISLGSRASAASLFAAAGGPVTTVGRNAVALIVSGTNGFIDADTEFVAVIAGTPTSGIADVEVEYTVPDETP